MYFLTWTEYTQLHIKQSIQLHMQCKYLDIKEFLQLHFNLYRLSHSYLGNYIDYISGVDLTPYYAVTVVPQTFSCYQSNQFKYTT